MDKDYIKGLKFGLGIITILGLVFGIVFAIGFHSADEIFGGTFNGNFFFNGTTNVQETFSFSCPSSSLQIQNTTGFYCVSNYPGSEESTASDSCLAIKTIVPTLPDGIYWIDLDGAGGNAAKQMYCDMTNGGWTLLFDFGNNNTYGVNSMDSKAEMETEGWTFTNDNYFYQTTNHVQISQTGSGIMDVKYTLPSQGTEFKFHGGYGNNNAGYVRMLINSVLKYDYPVSSVETRTYSFNSGDIFELEEGEGINTIMMYELWIK